MVLPQPISVWLGKYSSASKISTFHIQTASPSAQNITELVSAGNRSFIKAEPALRNHLLTLLNSTSTLSDFKPNLKTYMFSTYFGCKIDLRIFITHYFQFTYIFVFTLYHYILSFMCETCICVFEWLCQYLRIINKFFHYSVKDTKCKKYILVLHMSFL